MFKESYDLTYILDTDKYIKTKDMFREMSPFTQSMDDWLEDIGFLIAPASTKFHGAYPCGLAEHSMAVARKLQEITDCMELEWDRQESPIIVGLLHDLCKVESYIIHPKKDPWNPDEKEYIEWNKNQIYEGHGDKSVNIALRYAMNSGDFKLTFQEEQCIRFHMGAFDYKDEQKAWKYYGSAVAADENVLWTHTADMWADKVLNV